MANKDQLEGEVKEHAGRLTDDEKLEGEGKVQGAWGDTKEKGADLKDDLKDAVDDARDQND
jgi:uncharacterized protein YjbJ (UPF0337 family)